MNVNEDEYAPMTRALHALGLSVLLILTINLAHGQSLARVVEGTTVNSSRLVELRADPTTNLHRVLPLATLDSTATASFVVNFNPASCTSPVPWPAAAQAAFSYAANLWGQILESSVPIVVNACWRNLASGVLGSAGAAGYARLTGGGSVPNTWYPLALANAIVGSDVDTGNADINANFSNAFPNWYFGTDGNPAASQYDFVTVVMHEIGHGLGFLGFMQYLPSGEGAWGFNSGFPVIYDRFTQNGAGQSLLDTGLFPNPSIALGNQLISGNLFFAGANASSANGGAPASIYAPNPYRGGSSYSHLGEVFNNTPSAMMTYSLSQGEVAHDPGPVGFGLLQDIGWESGTPRPIITSHNAGDTLAGEIDTFTWDANGSGDEFWVYIGSTQGGYDFFNSGSLGSNTSVTVNGLPFDGESEVWFRLWHRTGDEPWDASLPDTYIDVLYYAGTTPGGNVTITSPLPSEALGNSATFVWNDPFSSIEYWIYAGSAQGKRDFYDSGAIAAGSTSHMVSGLPGHPQMVWIRLWYKQSINAPWKRIDVQYGTMISISPDPADPIGPSSQEFTFTGEGVTEWWVYAGTNTGLRNIANSGNLLSNNSYVVDGIDGLFGEPLFIRLWYKTGAAPWKFVDYTYFNTGDNTGDLGN